ncbi:MAG: hypothetical protein LBQ01_06860 [Prevotellaceae bacterium]|jgi:hypothetical protein|nr:hypothetical protein [Prevotellaceae bacterium]
MKRIISVFLLIIMAFASVRTTWDRHYCGGILRSVTLAGKSSTCCCGNDKGVEQDNSPDLPKISRFCCSDYLIDLATDSFDLSRFAAGTVQHIPKPFITHEDALKLCRPEDVLPVQYVFPPGAGEPARYNADLLTLICIFRI